MKAHQERGVGPVKIIQDWLKHWNLHSPERVALLDGESGERWTYRDLWQRAQAGAYALEKEGGLKKGDRVLYLGQNDLNVISLFFACARVGAILVPVNFRLTPRELSYLIDDSKPELIVHDEALQFAAHEGLANSSRVETRTLLLRGCESKTSLSFEALTQIPRVYPDFWAEPSDPAMIIYTSGTTGVPKGALISHGGLFWNAVSTSMRLNIVQSDCAVTFLPLFHTGGWNVLTSPFLHRGAQIVLIKKFDPELILQLSQDHKATLLFGVPTTMGMMARTKKFWNYDLSSVRYAIVGGEPMALELIQTWHDKKIPIRQGYGLTEFGPNAFSLNEQDSIRKIGSIGFPNAYISARVVQEDGSEAGPLEVGELWLQGPACMLGYWNHPEATQAAMGDGWLRTGDLVHFDVEGYFYVTGRKKDMFKSGGENVYPVEIEQVLAKRKGVREVAVIGVPDSTWGEVGKAFLVCDPGHFDESEIREHCSRYLAKFKIPKYFVEIQELPKSGAGKILKKDLPKN
jgi:fatty-acyl-CoA synthase